MTDIDMKELPQIETVALAPTEADFNDAQLIGEPAEFTQPEDELEAVDPVAI